MEINNLQQQDFTDLFATSTAAATSAPVNKFGVTMNQEGADLFKSSSTTETTTTSPSTTETTTIASASTTETTTVLDTDLLGDKNDDKKPKYAFSDASGYFEDRIKSGKFVRIEEQTATGETVDFIPKTPEEFDEVIELQVSHKLEQERKNLNDQWYQGKSQAWQAIAKYAELTDNPADILPFLQGVKTIESVSSVDEGTVEGAEKIVRLRLEQKGDTPELIEEQITALKTSDKLVSTGKAYKPMILQEEQRNLVQLKKQRELEELNSQQEITEIEESAIKAIETPFFGKKLAKEEKAIIYDLIALPSRESGGYKIFSVIDELFEKRDFATLREIALLAGKKDNFLTYISANASDKTAVNLQRQLRVASDSKKTGNNTTSDNDNPVIKRHKFTANFGR